MVYANYENLILCNQCNINANIYHNHLLNILDLIRIDEYYYFHYKNTKLPYWRYFTFIIIKLIKKLTIKYYIMKILRYRYNNVLSNYLVILKTPIIIYISIYDLIITL